MTQIRRIYTDFLEYSALLISDYPFYLCRLEAPTFGIRVPLIIFNIR
jgi:hypothetical protein